MALLLQPRLRLEQSYHNTHSTNIGGAQYNPFRYRGYYYDTDLGLYYLNSRYYDATTGRFLNADVFISTGQGILSYNMFAYCRNEPVFRKDTRGTSDVCVTHADEDNNPLNDLGGGGGGGRGFSVYYDSSAYGTYSIRTSVASYDANLGGYYYGGGATANIGYYYVPGAISVTDDMAISKPSTNKPNDSIQNKNVITDADSKRFTPQQQVVVELGKAAYSMRWISEHQAQELWEMAVKAGLDSRKSFHGPQYDSYQNGKIKHIKINGKHINILE